MIEIALLGNEPGGEALGKRLAAKGYFVAHTVRDPGDVWGLPVPSLASAACFGQLLILNFPPEETLSALNEIPEGFLKGKTVLDLSTPTVDHSVKYLLISFLEEMQKAWPQIHFIKAVNSAGNVLYPEEGLALYLCGDSSKAKIQVSEILEDVGISVYDMGFAESARSLDACQNRWSAAGDSLWDHVSDFL